jgi:hypothetical protein
MRKTNQRGFISAFIVIALALALGAGGYITYNAVRDNNMNMDSDITDMNTNMDAAINGDVNSSNDNNSMINGDIGSSLNAGVDTKINSNSNTSSSLNSNANVNTGAGVNINGNSVNASGSGNATLEGKLNIGR